MSEVVHYVATSPISPTHASNYILCGKAPGYGVKTTKQWSKVTCQKCKEKKNS